MEERKEMFNNALNGFYLLLYGKGQLRWQEKKPDFGTTWTILSFRLAARDILPTYRIAHTKAFVIPVVEDWLE